MTTENESHLLLHRSKSKKKLKLLKKNLSDNLQVFRFQENILDQVHIVQHDRATQSLDFLLELQINVDSRSQQLAIFRVRHIRNAPENK